MSIMQDATYTFTCVCAAGFSGQLCETPLSSCASTPCLNDGQCIDTMTGYRCECRGNFIGTDCQTLGLTIPTVSATSITEDIRLHGQPTREETIAVTIVPTTISSGSSASGALGMYSISTVGGQTIMAIASKVISGSDILPPSDQLIPTTSNANNGECVACCAYLVPTLCQYIIKLAYLASLLK